MSKNFYEQFDRSDDSLPSERSTGLVLAGAFVIIAYFWRGQQQVLYGGIAVAVVLAALSLISPRRLRLVNVGWYMFGMLLGRIVSPIVLGIMYLIAIVPAGLIMQTRYDPLQRHKKGKSASYWVDRQSANPRNMKNQF